MKLTKCVKNIFKTQDLDDRVSLIPSDIVYDDESNEAREDNTLNNINESNKYRSCGER